jgi:hypothetical protein
MDGMWSWTVHLWGCDIVFTSFLPFVSFLQRSQAEHCSLRCAHCSKKVEKRNMNTWKWQHRHTVHNHVPCAKHKEQGTSSMWVSHDMCTVKRINLSASTYIQVQLTKWGRKTANKPIAFSVTHTKNMWITCIMKVIWWSQLRCWNVYIITILVTHIVMSLVIGNSKCNLPFTLICICTFGCHYSPFFFCFVCCSTLCIHLMKYSLWQI